jgi:uncharacterized protein YjbI with pentapeptide repeats
MPVDAGNATVADLTVPVLQGTVHILPVPGREPVTLAPGKNYSGVHFDRVDLSDLTLTDCMFDGVVFRNCLFRATDLSRSSFHGAEFEECTFDDPSFFWCRLRNVSFNNCVSTAMRFTYCRFVDARLSGELSGLRLLHCDLTRTAIVNAQCKELTAKYLTLTDCLIERTHVPAGIFFLNKFFRCTIDRSNFMESAINGGLFENCTFVSAGFNHGKFRLTRVHDSTFHACRFRHMGHFGLRLNAVVFERCSFEGTDVSRATTNDCKFIIPSHSESTIWPDGMEPATDTVPT